MIERLLAAESALARGEIEIAGQLFAQVVAADSRNAIAVVGLARIAHREGRLDEAKDLAMEALVIDPDEAAARRLLRELLLGEAGVAVEAPLAPPRATAVVDTTSTEIDRPSIVARIRRWLAGLRRRG